MKKSIFSLSAALFLVGCTTAPNLPTEANTEEKNDTLEYVLTRTDTLEAMARAFARQESNGKEDAISPDGKYVGCLQIGEVMVKEANRLAGGQVFWCGEPYIDDRSSWDGSLCIFSFIMDCKNQTLNIDRAVDIWNVHAPKSYRENVRRYYKEELERLPYEE